MGTAIKIVGILAVITTLLVIPIINKVLCALAVSLFFCLVARYCVSLFTSDVLAKNIAGIMTLLWSMYYIIFILFNLF